MDATQTSGDFFKGRKPLRWAKWLGPPAVAIGIVAAWIAYSMDGADFGETLVVYREDGHDVQTVPIERAFDLAAERMGFPALELSRVVGGFQPQFVDAVLPDQPREIPIILIGLAKSEGEVEQRVSIVQAGGYTDIPIDPSMPIPMKVDGAQVWRPPVQPLELDGQTYHQYIARTGERELRISFAQPDEPPEAVVRELIESMIGE